MPKMLRSLLLRSSIRSKSNNKSFAASFHTSNVSCGDGDKKPEDEESSPLKRLLENAASFDDIKSDRAQEWTTLPYASTAKIRKQGDYFKKRRKDPRDSSIVLFPGQGTQYVGMGKRLLHFPMVKDLYELANYVLQYDLLKLCLEGPKEKLDATRHCQPAVMVASLAALEKLKEERPGAIDECVATAGFSLGEITALVFAGALDFERALKLVTIRAEAMQLASEIHKGTMATVFYGPDSKLNYACKKAREWALERGVELPTCTIANYLYPHCKVVAGDEESISYLENNLRSYNLRKIKRLPVCGAFHSDLMKDAVEPFTKALQKSDVSDPVVYVYSNVDGKRYTTADHIKRQLPKQIVKPVKWEQLLHVLYERNPDEYFPRTFECGPGTSLRAILKQVNAKAWDNSFSIEA